MNRGYKIGAIILLVLTLSIVGVYIYTENFNKDKNVNGKSVVVDKISEYNYTMDERDSKIFKSNFKELKKVLKNKDISYDKYAEYLAKLYIIDLYDINNKINKYDVPCLEYIFSSEKDKFSSMIKENFYSSLVDNSNKDRKQELPEVKSIELVSVSKKDVKLKDTSYEGYTVNLKWTYKKSMGYDEKAEVILVKDKGKLFVVKHTPIID